MHVLDILTIVCAGFMVGNELAVSAFVNPAVWQLDDLAQAKVLSLLARSLGKVMPFWYALCLVLIAAETYVHRREASFVPLSAAAIIWVVVIIGTLVFLVPINNRVGALIPASLPANWKQDHKKWDTLHRFRILLLLVAMLALTYALV